MKIRIRFIVGMTLAVAMVALQAPAAYAQSMTTTSGQHPPRSDSKSAPVATTASAPAESWVGPSPAVNDVINLVGDVDNFGYGGTANPPCSFYNLSEPGDDLGIFDRELSGGDEVESWTHTYTIPMGVTVNSVLIEIPEKFSDFNSATIQIDGTTYPFVVNGVTRCDNPIVQTFFFSGASASFAADGVVNMTFRENGDDIALDYSRLTINPSGSSPTADLAVSQTATPNPASANSPMVFNVVVTNNGPSSATNVVLTDTLPAATFNSASASQGSCAPPSGGVLTCNLGTIASGANATVAINVTPTSAGSVTNQASVAASETDPNTSNNTSSLTVQVLDADLALTLTDQVDPLPAGQSIAYNVSVVNYGPGPSYNLVATINIPATTAYAGASGASCWAMGTVVTCTRSSLAAAATWAFVVYAFVPANTPRWTTLTANASVTAQTPDPNTFNNSDSEDTLITTSADFAITAFTGPSTIPSGGGTFTVTSVNFGPSQLPFAELQIELPAGMTMLSATGGRCRITARQAFCASPGALAPGAAFAMSFSARGTSGGRYTMVARGVTGVPDPNGMNNIAQKQVLA